MNEGNGTGRRLVCARLIHREARLDQAYRLGNRVGLLKELATEQARTKATAPVIASSALA